MRLVVEWLFCFNILDFDLFRLIYFVDVDLVFVLCEYVKEFFVFWFELVIEDY